MKKFAFFLFLLLSLVISNWSLVIAEGETWQEMMDSTKFYQEKQDYQTALEWAQKALPKAKEEFGEMDTNYISTLTKIYELYYYKGDVYKAIEFCEIVMPLIEKIYGIDNPNYAEVLGNLGYLYQEIAKFNESEKLLKESLRLFRQYYQYDHPNLAISIENLAVFYKRNANYDKAKQLFFESLEMKRRIYKEDNIELANSINNIGLYFQTVGENKLAEPLLKESLSMFKRIFKGDDPLLANSINNLAVFYNSIGNDNFAEPLYIEALEMYRRIYKGNHPSLAGSLNNVSIFYYSKGEFKISESLMFEALEMYKQIYKDDHPQLAWNLNNIGYFYEDIKDYDKSEEYYKKSLEMYKRIYKNDNPDLAICMNNLAMFYKNLGDKNKAELLLKEALEMRKRLYTKEHPDLALSYFNLASFYLAVGDYKQAELLLLESLKIYLNLLKKYFPSLSEKEKNQYWSTISKYFEVFNSFVIKRAEENPSMISKMYDMQLFSKGLLLNSMLRMKNRILYSKDSALISKFEHWQFIKNKISKLSNISQKDLSLQGINLDSLENESNDLEKELSLLSDDFKMVTEKKDYKWQDVQAGLKQGEAAIEIVRFRNYEKRLTDTVYYAALILKSNSKIPELVLLENGNGLEGKYINEYKYQVQQQKKRVYDKDKSLNAMYELYNQFWGKIQGKLKGIKTVYLSPDGIYNIINLNTLINPKTKKSLIEELDLRVVTSTRDLIPTKKTTVQTENFAELFGDPQYNLDKAKYQEIASLYTVNRNREYYYLGNTIDSTTRQGIVPLPGTRVEIEQISDAMQKNKWTVKEHLGADAVEEAIKSVNSPRVLHIATHGKFLKDVEIMEERSFGMETERFVENPLLRSFLLFAGADNTLSEPEHSLTDRDDGLLTAYEAMNLNLDNTELVVLSACETGLGEIKNGEGVYGLQRAFQVAGAKSIIMSLWTVNDETTQELMSIFYKKWLAGKTKRQAFKEAQIELKKKYPEFYYWGAFVMVGE